MSRKETWGGRASMFTEYFHDDLRQYWKTQNSWIEAIWDKSGHWTLCTAVFIFQKSFHGGRFRARPLKRGTRKLEVFDVNNTKSPFVSSMRVVWREASNASMKLHVHHLKALETTQSRSNYWQCTPNATWYISPYKLSDTWMMVMGCCSNYSTLSHVARGASSRLAPALYRNKNFQVVTIQTLFAEGRLAVQGALKIRVCQYIKYIIYPSLITLSDFDLGRMVWLRWCCPDPGVTRIQIFIFCWIWIFVFFWIHIIFIAGWNVTQSV